MVDGAKAVASEPTADFAQLRLKKTKTIVVAAPPSVLGQWKAS